MSGCRSTSPTGDQNLKRYSLGRNTQSVDDHVTPHAVLNAAQPAHGKTSSAYKLLAKRDRTHFTLLFKAATAKAFTTVLAGLALTFTSMPKAMRLPAFVAGLCLVLIMQTPGIVNLPVLFTSLAASSAKASKAFDISDLFFSHAAPKASAMALLGMDETLFMAFFIPFFMAFIAFFAIVLSTL